MLEEHGALPTLGTVIELPLDDALPGHAQAQPADAGTLVTFHHRDVLGPLSVAEVAQDVAHLDIIGICLLLAHPATLTQPESVAEAIHEKRPSSTGADEGLGGRDEDVINIGLSRCVCPVQPLFIGPQFSREQAVSSLTPFLARR